MTERLAEWFVVNFGGTISREVIVFIVSLLPILELRGGIIVGYALGLELLPAFVISYIGNIIPIPFILLFIRFIFEKLKKTRLSGIINKLEQKAISKSDKINKYAFWGLLLFVAVPLPGTGGWTGALIAALLKLDFKKSFFTIALGVLIAGIIVSALSFGLLDALRS